MDKILNSVAPTTNVVTDAFTALGRVFVSRVLVANRQGADITVMVSVAPAGAADSNAQHLAEGVTCVNGKATAILVGLWLAVTDVIRVKASGAATFSVVGR